MNNQIFAFVILKLIRKGYHAASQPLEWNMTKSKGFSSIEILLSLLLITGTSLMLLRQQWQLNQTLNQRLSDSRSLIELDNHKELNHHD
ncbi:MAG: hypothetical protein H0T84_13525 [Tatlockia sp.]|nr:hypothetical protein [Tatlockia sp.]